MRAGIAAIPDGVYRFADIFDNPEIDDELEFSVEITVAGDAMQLHFDSPPQVRAGLNMVYTALLSTVYYAVKTVVDPTILPNAGLARPLKVTAQEGTILNCAHPAAVNGRIAACQRVVDLIHGALAQAVPERVTAAGNGACASRQLHRRSIPDGRHLGLSGDDRRRLRRAGDQGRPGRRPYPHDQHLEPAGRGAGARVSADAAALRAGRRFRRRRRPCAAAWACGASTAPRPSAGCRSTARRMQSAPWGLAGGDEGGRGDSPVQRRGRAVRPWLRPAAGRRHRRDHHAGRRRLRTARTARPRPVARDLADRRISPREARDVYKFAG